MMGPMKKRETLRPDAVIMPPPDPAVADRIAFSGRQLCRICNSPGASTKNDGLCWVCRRLKISAWRDVEKLGSAE
jgi:hypothetical protein